jgi:hypothetical protein
MLLRIIANWNVKFLKEGKKYFFLLPIMQMTMRHLVKRLEERKKLFFYFLQKSIVKFAMHGISDQSLAIRMKK